MRLILARGTWMCCPQEKVLLSLGCFLSTRSDPPKSGEIKTRLGRQRHKNVSHINLRSNMNMERQKTGEHVILVRRVKPSESETILLGLSACFSSCIAVAQKLVALIASDFPCSLGAPKHGTLSLLSRTPVVVILPSIGYANCQF